jgi:hypothetical protein
MWCGAVIVLAHARQAHGHPARQLIIAAGKGTLPGCFCGWAFRKARGRERGDLRQLYIRGATPEQAAEQVQAQYWNTRSRP